MRADLPVLVGDDDVTNVAVLHGVLDEDGQGEVVALEQRGLGPRREVLRDGAPALRHLRGQALLLLALEHDHHSTMARTRTAVMSSESLALRECPTSPHFIAPRPSSPPRPPAPPLRDHAPTPRDWAPRRSNIPCNPCGRWPRRRRGRAHFPARGEGG